MTTARSAESFQLTVEAAERYETAFVPAFFAQWAPMLCQAAGVAAGQSVLDVACGTGVVARAAADLVGADGRVVGVDLNPAMLTVAARVRPDLEWRQGDAGALPVEDGTFDAAVSQMAMMFFPDRGAAVAEMARAVAPGGTVAVLVPGPLASQPVFAPFVDVAVTYAGAEAASLLGAYFACGDLDDLGVMFGEAGLTVTSADVRVGRYGAPSVAAMVSNEVDSTPLGDRISPRVREQILAGTAPALAAFTAPDGSVDAPFGCNVVVGRR